LSEELRTSGEKAGGGMAREKESEIRAVET